MIAVRISFDDFIAALNSWFMRQPPGDLRYGQALFNALVTYRPDISEQLRGTRLDPFHREMSEIKTETWDRIAELW